jgi:hypothetical protein
MLIDRNQDLRRPSSRKVLTLTASGRPAMPGAGVMRTPGRPLAGSGGALPGVWKTQKRPDSSVIRWAETCSSATLLDASEGWFAGCPRCFAFTWVRSALAASDIRLTRSLGVFAIF